jgi:hypothetical protein
VYYHHATNRVETELADLDKKDKAKPTRSAALITPAAKKAKKAKKEPPRPDAANSSSMVIIPIISPILLGTSPPLGSLGLLI